MDEQVPNCSIVSFGFESHDYNIDTELNNPSDDFDEGGFAIDSSSHSIGNTKEISESLDDDVNDGYVIGCVTELGCQAVLNTPQNNSTFDCKSGDNADAIDHHSTANVKDSSKPVCNTDRQTPSESCHHCIENESVIKSLNFNIHKTNEESKSGGHSNVNYSKRDKLKVDLHTKENSSNLALVLHKLLAVERQAILTDSSDIQTSQDLITGKKSCFVNHYSNWKSHYIHEIFVL